MLNLQAPGAQAIARLSSRNEGIARVFKRDEGRNYFWNAELGKTDRRNIHLPVVGELIRDQNNPCYVNIVHSVDITGDVAMIFSTRLYNIVSSRVTLLDNKRARPFDWNRSSWEVVKQYKYVEIDDSVARDAALKRSYELYQERENSEDDEGISGN